MIVTANLALAFRGGELYGASHKELEESFFGYDWIRQIERASIRRFMERHRGYLTGRVMDFGAGTQPYRDLVDGEYVPIEKDDYVEPAHFSAVMCNQVLQYVDDPAATIRLFRDALGARGHLVLTYPTNWDEVEDTDLWRFTKKGMEKLVTDAGFEVIAHERRAEVRCNNFKFPLGYGLVAKIHAA